MKRTVSILLAAVLIVCMIPAASFASSKGASLSPQKLEVNGKAIECEKYNIYDYNYFKLRDIAKLLSGTGSQFEVGWDETTETISITTGEPYTEVGGELNLRGDYSKKAKVSSQTILIDGEKVSNLSVYNIGDNNFFKLRDLGNALGFDVDYDSDTDTAIVESSDSKRVSPNELCTAYGLPEGFKPYANPKTRLEYVQNFVYAFVRGNWEFTTEDIANCEWRVNNKSDLLRPYYDSLSMFENCPTEIRYANGRYYISWNPESGIDHDEVMRRLRATYEAALEIKNKLHSSGKITERSSQTQIAKAYYDELVSMDIPHATSKYMPANVTMANDSAYGCLINRASACGGKAATMDLFLHMEGILAASVHEDVWINGEKDGHVVTQTVLDGKEVCIDWGMKRGFYDPENPVPHDEKKGVTASACIDDLNSNRAFFGLIDSVPLKADSRISFTDKGFFSTTDKNGSHFSGYKYAVKMDNAYSDYDDSTVVNLCFAVDSVSDPYNIAELKSGVDITYGDTIVEHSYAIKKGFYVNGRATSVAGTNLPAEFTYSLQYEDAEVKRYSLKLTGYTITNNMWKTGYIYVCYGEPTDSTKIENHLINAYTYKQLTKGVTVEYKQSEISELGLSEGFVFIYPWTR